MGARGLKLASWCLQCTTREQRASQRCPDCFATCHNCGGGLRSDAKRYRCAGDDCGQEMYFCPDCSSLGFQGARTLCGTCWYADGEKCIFCGGAAQNHQKFLRACRPCHADRHCSHCKRMNAQPFPPVCVSCNGRAAMWCTQCHSQVELQSALCNGCVAA